MSLIRTLVMSVAFLVLPCVGASFAQESTPDSMPHAQHNLKDPKHWYPLECCHENDCAPVDYVERVEALKGRWMTTKHGRVFVPDTAEAHHTKNYATGEKTYTRPPKHETNPLHVCMRPFNPAWDKDVVLDPKAPQHLLCVIQESGL